MNNGVLSAAAAAEAKAAARAASPERAWRELVASAAAPYRVAGRFAWHFARGKLNGDPMFRHVLENGLIPPHARVLDIGCGQGLLASVLGASTIAARQGGWPSDWAPAPIDAQVTGIELNPTDVRRGRVALGDSATFLHADMRTVRFPNADAIALFDVLHYIGRSDQDKVLQRVHAALQPDGVLLLRVADANAGLISRLSNAIDRLVVVLRGGDGRQRLAIRPLTEWLTQLERLGFSIDATPMNGGVLFANVFIVARLQQAD